MGNSRGQIGDMVYSSGLHGIGRELVLDIFIVDPSHGRSKGRIVGNVTKTDKLYKMYTVYKIVKFVQYVQNITKCTKL